MPHQRSTAVTPAVALQEINTSKYPKRRTSRPVHTRTPPVPPHDISTTRSTVVINDDNRENSDMGDCLQEILNLPAAGKHSTCIHQGNETSSKTKWRDQTIRLYLQNVNGLRLQDDGSDVTEIFLQLQNIEADIFGIVETQIHCRSQHVQRQLQTCKRRVWEHCKLFTCSSEEEWDRPWKPGGTLLGVTGTLAGRVRQHHQDKYGRWIQVELLGRDGRTVDIICAYQVVQEKGEHGARTTYSQQVRMMRLDGINDPDPRKSFIRDLKALVKRLTQADHDIILMGDFNESIGAKPEEMASVITEGRLTDTFCFKHGLDREQPTYARGSKRVDYILVSERLTDYIRYTGAEPFNYRIFSDHRGLFVDFALPGFFDRAPNVLAKQHTRDLIYDCPRHVRQYLLASSKYLQEHQIPERLEDLLTGDRNDTVADSIDRDITRSMLAAEKTCKSNIRAPWSKALHLVMNKLYILKRALSSTLNGIDMSVAIALQQTKLDTPITIPDSLEGIKEALRQARRSRREVIKQGKQHRQQYQKDKIRALQMANPSKPPSKVEKVFLNTLASKEMFRRVPSARPTTSGGISMIKVPVDPTADPKDPNTTFQAIVDPVEVERHILERNRIHFRQAKDTPLANSLISDMIGFSGTSSVADRLLKGTIDVRALTDDRCARGILRSCKRHNPELPPEISLEEFKSSYKKWRVGTSTSPSGRHLSHQHALFQPHGIDRIKEPEEHAAAEKAREDNWQIQHGIVSYAVKYGFCIDRWKQVVNAMIEKEPGNPLLHRLRVIHLYESDYNSLLGIKMRQVIHRCEDLKSINLGTYGSRAHRQASDPTLIEVLQYDYAALTRWPSIKFNNDATSCYDRIIPSVSNVIARSMGLHAHIAQIHGDMLENAVYRIKTQLGISSGSYSHSSDSPVFGSGQGSCASPPFWLLNCSVYFDLYDSECHGATYYDMHGHRQLKMGMGGYVDDNGLNVNSRPSDEITLVARATQDAQLWSDLLWSSGGALEHSKCSYQYLQTEFTDTGRPFFRGGQFGTPITIQDASGTSTTLNQLSAYKSFKTLGTYQAATHCQHTQFEVLKKKAVNLSRVLALSHCSSNAAWLFYSSVFMKGVGYPLSVSRLTSSQLKTLNGPIVSLTLNRMHYNKRTPRVVVYGPRSLGGLEFGSLETTQGAGKLILLLRHLCTPGQPHDLLNIVLDRFQYMAGVGFNIMTDTTTILPHLEGIWIPSVRDYLGSIKGTVQIADMIVQPLERHGDRYIMDVALSCDRLTKCDIKFINYCRLHLQMLTISDMCNAAGTELADGVVKGFRCRSQSYSILEEPLQARPNELVWGIWRRFLRTFCYDKVKLMRPLGPWYAKFSTRRRWPNYYTMSTATLSRQTEEGTYLDHQRIRTRVFSTESIPSAPDDPKVFPVPIDIAKITDGWRISLYAQDIWPSPMPTEPQSFLEYITTLPNHERLLLKHCDFLAGNAAAVCSKIQYLQQVILVSDGGAAADFGSFGWVLGLQDGTRLAQGSGVVYGHDPKSYRAEAHGAKAGSLLLFHLFKFYNHHLQDPTNDGGFQYYCDNDGLLKKLEVFRRYENAMTATCLHSEWDIVSAIHTLHSSFQWRPHLFHVKGHQDNHADLADLDLPTLMNIEADALATAALKAGTSQPTIPFDPASGAMLSINGRAITRHIEATLHRHEHTEPIQVYYCARFNWTNDTLHSIDWDSYHISYKPFARTRTFFYKNGWKQLPIGRRLHKWTPSYEHRCPSCDQDHETDDHIYQCTHIQRKHWRQDLFRDVQDTFGSFLDSDLLAIIKIGLTSFFHDCPPSFSDRFPPADFPSLQILITQQNAIGWDHFVRGKLSKEWSQAQYRHAKRFNLVDVSKNWLVTLTRLLANSSFKLWEIRNGCRHGIDAATKQQAKQDQAHRELRCLYLLKPNVLPQDLHFFCSSVEKHLEESTPKICTWIIHHRKLITHSARLANAQARLRIKHLKTFFPLLSTKRSLVQPSADKKPEKNPPIRHRPTRIASHFKSTRILRSTSRTRTYTGSLSVSTSPLPTIPEDTPRHPNATERRQLQRRLLHDTSLFPDHPG